MKFFRVKYIKDNILCVDYFRGEQMRFIPKKDRVETKEIDENYYNKKREDIKKSITITFMKTKTYKIK